MESGRSWYQQPWGIGVLAYVAVTAALGIWLAVSVSASRARGTSAQGSAVWTMPEGVVLVTADDPAIGVENAALTIVEFGDFQCPFCRQSFPIFREVSERYAGRVRIVYRDFPVEDVHADARRAAEAAQCAHAQGKFWPYHDRLFQRQEELDAESLARHAEAVGLDRSAFDACVSSRATSGAVEGDLQTARALGVRGTPTWFFMPNGDVQRTQRFEGAIPRDMFQAIIESAL